MKNEKKRKRYGVLLCALMLAMSLSACGPKEEEPKSEPKATEEVVPNEPEEIAVPDGEEETTKDGVPVDGMFDSIQAMIDSDLMKNQLESMLSAMEDSGMVCELTADEDSLIYNFTITDEGMAETLTKDVLDPQLSQMASTFENIGSVLPSMVEGLDNPSIIVRYLGPDGTEITSMEFFASDTE